MCVKVFQTRKTIETINSTPLIQHAEVRGGGVCQTLQSLHALQTLQTLQIVKMKPFFLFNRVALSKNKTLILAEFVLEEG